MKSRPTYTLIEFDVEDAEQSENEYDKDNEVVKFGKYAIHKIESFGVEGNFEMSNTGFEHWILGNLDQTDAIKEIIDAAFASRNGSILDGSVNTLWKHWWNKESEDWTGKYDWEFCVEYVGVVKDLNSVLAALEVKILADKKELSLAMSLFNKDMLGL